MLYQLNIQDPRSSARVQVKSPAEIGVLEKHIEEFLLSRLSEVVSEEQLMLIGQERRYQEEADLLALDQHGVLYIFELKRWQSCKENLLQVMRYGQIFGQYSYAQLEDLAKRQQKLDGYLRERHQEYFQLDETLPESKFNHDQVFVLIASGVDRETISAVNYWSKKGVKIECVPYRIYDIAGEPYIQFDTYDPDADIIIEESTQIFIVNTNKSYMPEAWRDMLNDGVSGKAAAYYDRKSSVCKITKGSVVYFYHTGMGIVAKGIAIANFGKKDYQDDFEEEYYVPVKFNWSIVNPEEWESKAPKAWQINEKVNVSHRFRQTVFSITKDMADAIDSIAKERSERVNG